MCRGLTSVRPTAATAGCIFADAVPPDGCTPAGVPPDAVVGCARFGVTADAVHPSTPVPTSEFASSESGAAVAASAWKLKSDSSHHRLHLGV